MSSKMLEKYGFILASRYRKKTILSLENKPKTPNQIALENNSNLTHISRALRELTEKEMTRCATPKRIKGRLYQLTSDGKEILKLLKK